MIAVTKYLRRLTLRDKDLVFSSQFDDLVHHNKEGIVARVTPDCVD